MGVIYNDVDITEKIQINSAVHEMNVGGCADTLDIAFGDENHLWSRWKPQKGDTISFSDGGTSTGKLYVSDFSIKNREVTMLACSIPPSFNDIYSKTWEEVYLSQILGEVTSSYQLNAIDDVWYRYKNCNTRLISFLNQLAELEGAVLIVAEDKVMFVNEQALEAQEAGFQLDCAGANVNIRDERATLFDACIVQSGEHFGLFKATSGERHYRPQKVIPCASDAEAYRYAKALLRMANKGKTSVKWKGQLIPEMSAGITVDFINEDNPSWNGKMYCYRVRHDYRKRETTIYMRKPLEGY